jgi:hypothetical protein
MAKITEVKAYFQGTCFPQKFVGVQVGFGYSATLSSGDDAAEVEAKLYNKAKKRVEQEIKALMRGAKESEDD